MDECLSPITHLEVYDLEQPTSCIFIINQVGFGAKIIANNEKNQSIIFTYGAGNIKSTNEIYFYDPLTTYRILKRRRKCGIIKLERNATAKKIVLDTFKFIIKKFSSNQNSLTIYLTATAHVFNMLPDNNANKLMKKIQKKLNALNKGIISKGGLFVRDTIIPTGEDNFITTNVIDLPPYPYPSSLPSDTMPKYSPPIYRGPVTYDQNERVGGLPRYPHQRPSFPLPASTAPKDLPPPFFPLRNNNENEWVRI